MTLKRELEREFEKRQARKSTLLAFVEKKPAFVTRSHRRVHSAARVDPARNRGQRTKRSLHGEFTAELGRVGSVSDAKQVEMVDIAADGILGASGAEREEEREREREREQEQEQKHELGG